MCLLPEFAESFANFSDAPRRNFIFLGKTLTYECNKLYSVINRSTWPYVSIGPYSSVRLMLKMKWSIKMKKSLCLLTAFILLTCAVLAGCSSKESENLTTAEVLTKSYDSMQAASSFHFSMEHDKAGTPISKNILMTSLSGDIVSPDKLQAKIIGTYSDMAIEVSLVTVGDQTYMTNPISGAWELAPKAFQVLSVFDPGTGVAAIINGLTDVTDLGDEKVGKTKCYHLSGNVLSEDLAPLTGTTATGVKIGTEVWISKKTLLVQQIKLTGKITDTEEAGITRMLTFSNYNKDVDITLPE